jgi:hypothetical protein
MPDATKIPRSAHPHRFSGREYLGFWGEPAIKGEEAALSEPDLPLCIKHYTTGAPDVNQQNAYKVLMRKQTGWCELVRTAAGL